MTTTAAPCARRRTRDSATDPRPPPVTRQLYRSAAHRYPSIGFLNLDLIFGLSEKLIAYSAIFVAGTVPDATAARGSFSSRSA